MSQQISSVYIGVLISP